MLRAKQERSGLPVKATAVLLVLMMLISLFAVGVVPVRVDAASAALSGGEAINIYLQDSSWQGSDIRVRFLDSGGSQLSTVTKTPSGNKITVTGVRDAAKLYLEKVNSEKSANLAAMQSVVNGASAAQSVVFYDNASTRWSDLKYYAWTKQSGTTYEEAAWTLRKAMTIVPGTSNLYYAKINRNTALSAPYQNIIFTGSGGQTADLALNASTASAVKVYTSAENKWITYTDIDRSLTVDVSGRYADDLNDLYLTSKTAAKWSKYNDSTPTRTVYFKPNSGSWTSAWVHYDDSDDEPYYRSVQMTPYSSSPLIYQAEVYFGAMVSFSTEENFDSSAKKDQGSVYDDAGEPVYVAKDRSWTTLDNAMATEDRYSDFTVSNNNFATAVPAGNQGKVVGFSATYYDYLSNNEHEFGWRKSLDDSSNFPDSYRMQFSDLNNDIISAAIPETKWRYPLVFGDDTTAGYFIDTYYSRISGTRSPAITKDNFRAANNSSFLGGDSYRNRSIMGLVKNKLSGGDLMVTEETSFKAPYFDNDWLAESKTYSDGEKYVLYILDDTGDKDSNNIFCNFWGGGADTSKVYDTHPGMVARNVTIGGVTGTLYRYVVDSRFTNVQLRRDGKGFDQAFWKIEDGSLANFKQVIRASNGYALTSSTYKSGKQTMSRTGKRAMIIDSKFPFVETTDPTTKVKSYVFDSGERKDNIAFDFNESDLSNSTLNYYSGNGVAGKLDNRNGFFPFNTKSNNYPRNYGFGMRVDIDFTLPKDGLFDGGTPAEFHYSGDDDVWVFVDGNLILDLGGAHTPTTGSINFGAGVGTITATSDTVYRQLNQTEKDTQVFEFVFNKPSSEPSGYLAKWDGGQYPGSGQTPWSSLNGKAFYTSGKVDYLSDDFKSYDDASGKRHIFVVNDSSKTNVAIYSTDNSLGDWNTCVPTNNSYKSKVSIYSRSYTQTVAPNDASINGSQVTKTFSFNNTDPTKKHHMTVFYMERGTNDSNLKIEFSIQPVLNELDVYKEVQFEELNTGVDDAVTALAKNSDFGFTFNQNSSGYGGSGGKKFNYVHADDTTTTDTIYNGSFSLKHYEEAMFNNDTDLTFGSSVYLAENKPSLFSYDTQIEVKDILNGTEEPVVNGDSTSFLFANSINNPDERTLMIAEFINTLQTSDITLHKDLYKKSSTVKSEDQVAFEFTVKLDLDNDQSFETYDLEYYYVGDEDNIYIAEDGVVQMRQDQEIVFFGIPVNTAYQITETPLSGYSIKPAACQNTEGSVSEDGATAIFANEEDPAAKSVTVTKTLDGSRYSGTEFAFKIDLIKWKTADASVVTDTSVLNGIYPGDTRTTVTNGVISFMPFEVIPSNEHVGQYTFKITEVDKSDTQPWYNYDSTEYYALIDVRLGSMEPPVYYSDPDCTVAVEGTPSFVNTTRLGTINLTKNDADSQPIEDTEFAVIKVSSEAAVDNYLTPDVINSLVEASVAAGDGHVRLERTDNHGTAVFDELALYQKTGQYVYNTVSKKIEWSTDVTPTAKQTYCVFEYTPTSGYLPNYTKGYVVLADEPNCSRTFGYVDGRIVMPNASGPGAVIFRTIGLTILCSAALLGVGYVFYLSRRRRPAYVCRHLKK